MSKTGGWLQKCGIPRALYINADLLELEMTLLVFFFPFSPQVFSLSLPFLSPLIVCVLFTPTSGLCVLDREAPPALSCDGIPGRVHQEH